MHRRGLSSVTFASGPRGWFFPDGLIDGKVKLTLPDKHHVNRMLSGKFKERVDREAKEGNSFGATGTPTFFINGHILVGAQPVDAFKTAIDAELK